MNLPGTNETAPASGGRRAVDGTALESTIGIAVLLTAVDGDG